MTLRQHSPTGSDIQAALHPLLNAGDSVKRELPGGLHVVTKLGIHLPCCQPRVKLPRARHRGQNNTKHKTHYKSLCAAHDSCVFVSLSCICRSSLWPNSQFECVSSSRILPNASSERKRLPSFAGKQPKQLKQLRVRQFIQRTFSACCLGSDTECQHLYEYRTCIPSLQVMPSQQSPKHPKNHMTSTACSCSCHGAGCLQREAASPQWDSVWHSRSELHP